MKLCLAITTCERESHWHPGDPMILDGLHNVLPELSQHELFYYGAPQVSELAHLYRPLDEQLKEALECDYVIGAGTAGWYSAPFGALYRKLIKAGRHFSLLAVGSHAGPEDVGHNQIVQAVAQSGLCDLVICRDAVSYRTFRRYGFPQERLWLLPCSGLFAFRPPSHALKRRDHVAVCLAGPGLGSSGAYGSSTFLQLVEIVVGLEAAGVRATLVSHLSFDQKDGEIWARNNPDGSGWMCGAGELEIARMYFPGHPLRWFTTREECREFYLSCDAYIGMRLHGAIACSGLGLPSLGIGVDRRQFAWDTCPLIAQIDGLNQLNWSATAPVNWYMSCDIKGLSTSLLKFRLLSAANWRKACRPILEERL